MISSRLTMTIPALTGVLVACSISFSVCVKAADESKSEVASAAANTPAPALAATNSAAVVAIPAPVPTPVNPRVAVIERITKAAMQAMAASNDAIAVALSAKYMREANLKAGETREPEQKNDLQMAALVRAKQLADKQGSSLVDFQMAMFCLGFPAKSLCVAPDPVLAFAESDPDNAMGWIAMAVREFTQGLLNLAGPHLEKAGAAKRSVWFYHVAAATALKYAKAVEEPMRKVGDNEAAAFGLLDGMMVPPFRLFAQLCNPSPEGKLPEGRYPICRRAAQVLIDEGQSQAEPAIGYRVLERLANGEKLPDQATLASASVMAFEAAGRFVWQSIQKFPPQSDADGAALVQYFADLIQHGERRATQLALKRAGKTVADFAVRKEQVPCDCGVETPAP